MPEISIPATLSIDPADLPPGPPPPESPTVADLVARVARLEAMLGGQAQIPATVKFGKGAELHFNSALDSKGCAKDPYSGFLRFVDDNPANPLGGSFQLLAHQADDQCPAGFGDHICIYGPNPKAKNGRDHVLTVEAATAANGFRPRISLGGGMFGAQVDFLDSDLFRKDPHGSYQRDVLSSTTGDQHTLTNQAPLKPV